jgi:dihydrofolate synthase/folylpolyglutamate synthase
MGYEEAIGYLYGLQKHGIKLGLDNPRRLLAALGNPQGSFKSIHVAGTNGKGSTSAMTEALLKSALRGAGGGSPGPVAPRVALFTSPHLVSFTERIRVDGEVITEGDVVSLTEEIRGVSESAGINPTFFEFVTAMGFLYFKRKGADWAVVETGMGGRLDATNVIRPEVSIITSISLDHKEFLGGSLAEIAAEKAGIIKEGVPVVSARQEPAAMEVIRRRAEELGAPLYVAGGDFEAEKIRTGPDGVEFDYLSSSLDIRKIYVPLRGSYQAENASLAIKAFALVSGTDPTGESIKNSLKKGLWPPPGRLEWIAPDILIDGAHNPAAARALAEAIKEIKASITNEKEAALTNEKGAAPLALVLGVMSDKDIEGIMEPLFPLADEVVLTSSGYERSASPEELLRRAVAVRERLGLVKLKIGTAATVKEAIAAAGQKNPSFILVTGSFYTIGEAKESVAAPAPNTDKKGPVAPAALRGLSEWQKKRR